MKRWIWAATAAMAFLLGASNANAEYVIIRVILNKSAMTPPSTGGFGVGGGGTIPGGQLGIGGMPPPGGALGIGGMLPPGGQIGISGGPPPGGALGIGGRPGGPGGPPPGGALGPPPGGPGGPGGPPPSGAGGSQGPPAGAGGFGGGATGFVGGGPGGPGMPPRGASGNTPTPAYKLGPDDYVTVVVPVNKLAPLAPGTHWGKGPDGKLEHIGVAGNFRFETKFGTTYIDANQADIILDYKGIEKSVDQYPDPKKQLERNRRDSKRYGSPEGQIALAEWCLEVGMPDEAAAILEKLIVHPAKDTFKPTTTTAVTAYTKVKDLLAASVEKTDRANSWKDRLNYPALSVSKHYAIVHEDNTQASANRRLDALEMNFKTVYLWFALRGRALPAPSEKLVALIVGDATRFRNYRDTFEATNLVADGFYARRENLAVFSGRRLDKASVNFEQLVRDVYRVQKAEELFKPALPKLRENPNGPDNYRKYANASTLALVDNLLQEEAEIAAATHEGTKQLFAETGLLPRNVLAPEWLRFGIAALFEMPKGPFPGGTGQLKVALYPGGGGPHWAYMRYFEEMREANLITQDTAPELFIETVIDEHFRNARQTEAISRLISRKNEEGDSKATPAEELYARARTLAWSVVYFMAKAHFNKFEVFLDELAKLPRDAELDANAVVTAFCKAYGVSRSGIEGATVDIGDFAGVGLEWKKFMDGQQSPSRTLKIDSMIAKPAEGTGPGGPGGPGGFPGGPGGPGGGFPGGPGGPGGPGAPGRPGGPG